MTALPDLAKVAHALTARDDLLIGATQRPPEKTFWPYTVGTTIYAPERDMPRGSLDLAAFWIAKRHYKFGDFLPPGEEAQGLAYLDLARVASLGSELKGVRANINHMIEDVVAHKTNTTLSEALFAEAARRFIGTDIPSSFPHIPDALWQKLHDARHDGAAYYKIAQQVMRIAMAEENADNSPPDDVAPPDSEVPSPSSAQDGGTTTEMQDGQSRSDELSEAGVEREEDGGDEHPGGAQPQTQQQSPAPSNAGSFNEYHAYTKAFDAVIKAVDMGTTEEALALRHALDTQGAASRALISRLARKLEQALRAHDIRHTEREMDDGTLDTTRLARIVAAPARTSIYQQTKITPARNAVVSLLIDNSGSMRGRPILTATLTADVLALTLERCGVPCEILGFTTRSWKGGQARVSWVENGRPNHPGRLNDLAHIIYKDASTPWRRARLALALATKDGILKENIDGEALMWASGRLMARPEPRKILIIISDGAPVDDSTLSANDSLYLERHLHSVVQSLSKTRGLELHAIGIGHDVTHTYPSAMTVRDVEELGPKLLDHLVRLFKR